LPWPGWAPRDALLTVGKPSRLAFQGVAVGEGKAGRLVVSDCKFLRINRSAFCNTGRSYRVCLLLRIVRGTAPRQDLGYWAEHQSSISSAELMSRAVPWAICN
jgi:hypothetical protein